MQKSRRLWLLAIGSFVAAPVLALLTGQEEQYLAYAAALFLLMALPGWLLMRAARG
jgi:predicted membrane protein